MAPRSILKLPDPRLRATAEPVAEVDDGVRVLLDDMLETMYDAPGIGLAGNQIGVLRRLVVIDVARDDEPRNPLFLVNPEIVWLSAETGLHEEGCLSIPEYYEEVERPLRCTVRYLDRNGAPREREADGLLARCIQHEVDHLNGVLFIDHLSRLKRDRITRKFTKVAKRDDAEPVKRKPGPLASPPPV